jgi:Glycosyltransferase family 87
MYYGVILMLFRMQSPKFQGRSSSFYWKIAILAPLLLLTSIEFTIRGPVRAVHSGLQFNDFLSPYVQSKALVLGLDPYSPESLLRLWPKEAAQYEFLRKEVADGTILTKRGIPTAYPLPCLILIAPFTLLSWPEALLLWIALNIVCFLMMVFALLALIRLRLDDLRTYTFLILVLGLAPIHTGMALANMAILSTTLSVIAILSAIKREDITAGILLAVASGLKPQIGLCFVLYYLLLRRWRMVWVAGGIIIVITFIATVRLQITHIRWLTNYLLDNRALFANGILTDFTPRNPTRLGLVNLQLGLYPLVHSADIANALTYSVTAVFFVVWTVLVLKRRAVREDLLFLSTITVISLLPIYHRFYDAAVLVLPVAWCFGCQQLCKRSVKMAVILIVLPFLIPGGSLIESLQDSGRIPGWLLQRWWWNILIAPHQAWALLILAILLLCSMWILGDRENLRNAGTS